MRTAPNPLRTDPTRTVTLRKKFLAEMDRRFARFKRTLVELITKEDAFGLVPLNHDPLKLNSLTVNDRFRFHTTPQKVEAFRKWLAREMVVQLVGATAEQIEN